MAGNYSYDPEKRIFCGEDDDGNAILIQGDRAFEFAETVENQCQFIERLAQFDEAIIKVSDDVENLKYIKADINYVDGRFCEEQRYKVNEAAVANIAEEVVKQYLFDLIEKRRSMKQEKASVTDEELFELLDILNITEVE